MAVSFDDIPFAVYTDDGFFPQPASDEQGIVTYSASIKITNSTRMDSLRALISIYTIKQMLGGVNQGTLIIEAGPGVRTLIYPDDTGERVYDAVLTSVSPSTTDLVSGQWRVDAEWLVLEETP